MKQYATDKLIRDANILTEHERHVLHCKRCKRNRVYSLINYVAAFALIVLTLVIYLEPVSR